MLWIICGLGVVTALAVIGWRSRDAWRRRWQASASRSRKLVAAIAVGCGLAVLATLLIRMGDGDQAGDAPASSPSSDSSRGPAASGPRIETTKDFYFSRPSETVQIPGRYRGVQGSRELRVELRQGSDWTQFPLPVVTQQSGEFRAFVYLGKTGTYQLRIVAPDERRSSKRLTVQVL